MNATFYHAMALAGWLFNIAGHLLVQYQNPFANYIQGFPKGMPLARVRTRDYRLGDNHFKQPQSKT
jgi:hypothetical protein